MFDGKHTSATSSLLSCGNCSEPEANAPIVTCVPLVLDFNEAVGAIERWMLDIGLYFFLCPQSYAIQQCVGSQFKAAQQSAIQS